MRRVILESPYAGDVEANVAYARRCLRDSLSRGEAPIASHLLYTQPGVLRDDVPDERKLGINAGLAWRYVAEAAVIYTDRGISEGMKYGIAAAQGAGLRIEYRTLNAATDGCPVTKAAPPNTDESRPYDPDIDALESYNDAMMAIGERVKAGAPVPESMLSRKVRP